MRQCFWSFWILSGWCAAALWSAELPDGAGPSGPPLAGEGRQAAAPLSPVDRVRELLALDPVERADRLADKPPGLRRALLDKLKGYDDLAPEERERRLRAAEFRYYLEPLLRLPRSERTAALEAVPEEYRALVEGRLQQWDLLSPAVQSEVLESDWMVQYVVRFSGVGLGGASHGFRTAPAAGEGSIEETIAEWKRLPEGRRQQMFEHFQQFFVLPVEEKKRTLDLLPREDREEMAAALEVFGQLDPRERRECIDALQRFVRLTSSERTEFLRHAERWQQLTAHEREVWRGLVNRVAPLPPGTIPFPPRPPGLAPKLPGELPDR